MDPESTSQQPTHPESQVVENKQQDAIHYEDGKIQKKIYGGDQVGDAVEIFLHLIQADKMEVETVKARVELGLTIKELRVLVEQKTKIALNNLQVKTTISSTQPLPQDTPLSTLLPAPHPQLLLFYTQTTPTIKPQTHQLKYQPLTKYSFIDDKSKVKVYIELPEIGKIAPENIVSRFLEWSIEVKIHDYKGKNWIFAVPKTQCIMKNKDCKVLQKDNKIIVVIAKNTDSDNWFSLYKVRCVGDKGDDY